MQHRYFIKSFHGVISCTLPKVHHLLASTLKTIVRNSIQGAVRSVTVTSTSFFSLSQRSPAPLSVAPAPYASSGG